MKKLLIISSVIIISSIVLWLVYRKANEYAEGAYLRSINQCLAKPEIAERMLRRLTLQNNTVSGRELEELIRKLEVECNLDKETHDFWQRDFVIEEVDGGLNIVPKGLK